jgi:hypothetical protein
VRRLATTVVNSDIVVALLLLLLPQYEMFNAARLTVTWESTCAGTARRSPSELNPENGRFFFRNGKERLPA